MPRKSDARQRAILTAARLFQRQGYFGTGLAQILEQSGAPKGSFYHHFPGGKEELALEAIHEASRGLESLFAAAAEASEEPGAFVRTLARGIAYWIEASDFTDGCPVAIFTLESTPAAPALQEACRESFVAWQRLIADGLSRNGGDRARAERLAEMLVAALEGALLLAMAEASTRPIEVIGEELAEHVATVMRSRGS